MPASSPTSVRESVSPELGQLLRHVLSEESALYTMVREWRYDAAGRKFLRLHALLDKQFTAIGERLARVAERGRVLGCWASSGHGDRVKPERINVDAFGLEAHMLTELLTLHEALLSRLREGNAMVAARFHDRETTSLFADLILHHEKDASTLRTLLRKIRTNAA